MSVKKKVWIGETLPEGEPDWVLLKDHDPEMWENIKRFSESGDDKLYWKLVLSVITPEVDIGLKAIKKLDEEAEDI